MQFKDRIVYTEQPAIVADIERNGFGDPVPVKFTGTGYWVYAWSMEQYKARHHEAHAEPS